MGNKTITEVVYKSVKDLHKIGLVDEVTMRKFDAFKSEIPNKTTLKAMEEARQGKGKRYKSLEELYKEWEKDERVIRLNNKHRLIKRKYKKI